MTGSAATAEAPVGRPLRKDAARNRELLLAAAAKVFARQGLGASVEEVAREAGVGVGTLYRRFATKEELVDALVHDVLTRFVRLAEDAAAASDGSGLEEFLRGAAALQADHTGCLPRLWNSSSEQGLVEEARRRIADLLTTAQRRGRVRPDVTPTDISVMLWSLRGVIETSGGAVGAAWQRHLELLLAGLRPSDVPLTHPPLTRQQVDALMR